MSLMTKDQAQKFFSQVKLEDDGTPSPNLDREGEANYLAACSAMDVLDKVQRWFAKRQAAAEKKAAASAAAQQASQTVYMRISRSGFISLYYGGKFPITLPLATWKRVLPKITEALAANDGDKAPVEFWPASPERKMGGKLIPAAAPVIVRASRSKEDDKFVLFTGDAAVAEAKRLNIYRTFNGKVTDEE